MTDSTLPAEEALDYEIFRDIVINHLNAGRTITLATAGEEGPHARTVEYVNLDLRLGFFSWRHTRKAADLARQQNVALCLNNMQIEGVAQVQENLARGNADMMLRYRTRQPALYARFAKAEDACFVVVQPKSIKLMKVENGTMLLDVLDVAGERAYRTKLADWG